MITGGAADLSGQDEMPACRSRRGTPGLGGQSSTASPQESPHWNGSTLHTPQVTGHKADPSGEGAVDEGIRPNAEVIIGERERRQQLEHPSRGVAFLFILRG